MHHTIFGVDHWSFPRNRTGTLSWSAPVTSKLLLDVRGAIHGEDIRDYYPTDPSDPLRSLIAATEQGGLIPGLTYRGRCDFGGAATTGIAACDQITSNTAEMKSSMIHRRQRQLRELHDADEHPESASLQDQRAV